MKSALVVATIAATANCKPQKNIFDEESDFMKGFETGVMMRSKKTTLEEFGCSAPDELKSKFGTMMETISGALDTVQMFIPDDFDFDNAFNMLKVYMDGLSGLALVVDPASQKHLDDYCRGMIFGVEGTKVLFNVSSILRNNDPASLEKTLNDGVKKIGKAGKSNQGAAMGLIKDLGGALLGGMMDGTAKRKQINKEDL